MHAQRCNKHNALIHDFFVSYRVSTDNINSEKLTAHLEGKKRPDGENFITYLDKNCLIQGQDWEEGFKFGINNSKAILLLISQGLITTMIRKAIKGEEDNVLKEYKLALELLDYGRLVIPIYVASLSTTQSKRDCYIKLDRRAALRQFNITECTPEAKQRLEEVKKILEQIFLRPKFVHMEPDSIADQIPKIIQFWYAEFAKKNKKKVKKGAKSKNMITSSSIAAILYPSQSFRLTFIGFFIGLIGILVSLSLLFMPSKSKQHTNIKYGIVTGNIIGFIIILFMGLFYFAEMDYKGTRAHCTKCEVVFMTFNETYNFNKIPHVTEILGNCSSSVAGNCADDITCLQCVCNQVYLDCQDYQAKAMAVLVIVGLQIIFIIGTIAITMKFTKAEAFSLSLTS